ncbi:MAG: VWA domain-containing protein, partial [Peptococcaceae bacterium]|nr:VWA domain-containing protein [Peptococcaceae bacterium]
MRGLKNKKAVAWIVMLVFLFTCVMPSGTALAAANNAQQIEYPGGETSNAADGVTISKVISGTNQENYFDITLTVKTPQAMEELIKTVPTDVVIVMDISNTMNTNMSNNKSRLANAKTAANQFITDFKAMMGDSGQVGIVTFNTHAQKVKGLSTDSAANLKNAVNSIQASPDINSDTNRVRFTNIEAGLQLATNMLNASDRAEQEYIILLTDGFPTTYIKSGKTNTSSITGYIPYTSSGTVGTDGVFYNNKLDVYCPYGVDYSDKGAAKAQSLANNIKKTINIFTIGIGDHTINGYTPKRVDGNGTVFSTIDCYDTGKAYVISSDGYDAATNADAYKQWLKNKIGGGPDMAGKTTFVEGTNLTTLRNAYTSIFNTIKEVNIKKVQDTYIAADPMGADVEFQYFYNMSGKAAGNSLTGSHEAGKEDTAAYKNNKINWELLKSGYKVSGSGNKKIYTYELKYRVRLENE